MPRSLIFGAMAPLLLAGSIAAAQDTGTVTGAVVDRTGRPVAGATVRIVGDAASPQRTTLTSDRGEFGLLLLPGEYVAEVEKTGVGKTSRRIVVEVARETRWDIILGALTTDPVVVTGTAVPDVDPKSTEVTFSYRRSLTQDLPLDRSYLGLMQLIPGVAERQSSASTGSSGRQDNTFLLDSVNISNPFFGYLSSEINELDIAEFDVKRGAIRPEFGRTTGLITNVVVKSGGNAFTGAYRFEAIPSAWVAESDKVVRSRTNRWVNAGDLGGPIVTNRVFFYASGSAVRSSSPDAVNIFGALPTRVEKTNEYFGKLTARAGLHVINAGVRRRPSTVAFAGIGPLDAPEVASNIAASSFIANVNYDWFLGSRTTLSVKYIHLTERNEAVAVRDLGFEPHFEEDNVAGLGHVVIGGVSFGAASLKLNRQDYFRDEVKGTLSHFVETGSLGHQFKLGFGWDEGREELTRRSNGWGDISYVILGSAVRVRATTYPDQPAQHSTGRTYSMFVQDDITLGPRVTVNAGVLVNRDEFVQRASGTDASRFPSFGFLDEIQPRAGLTMQLRQERGDKAYVNYGRYFGLDQKSSARAVAAGRLYTVDTDFNPITGAITGQAVSANTGVKSVADTLDPPRTDEVVVGYATPIGGGWTLDAFFLARKSDRFIEDAPTLLPFSSFRFQNDPFAERTYKTVTVEVRRRLQDQWSLNFSYAWSRLTGNYDADYSGSFTGAPIFNTSSLMDDGPGAFSSDRFRSGPLSQDRTHVYKLLGTWSPKAIDDLSIGAFVRGQSGTPWEARGLPWDSGLTYLRFLEPAGTHRTPFWTNVDLMLKYRFLVKASRTLQVEGRALNLFNSEQTLLVDQRAYLDPRNLTINGSPASGCWSCYTDAYQQGTLQTNTHFGQPVVYATPRRFLFSVSFDF